MVEDSKTILEEYIIEDNPLRGLSYSIIRNRLVAMGGIGSNNIKSKIMDNHYLIFNEDINKNFLKTPLAIIDINKSSKRIAKKIAKMDKNKLLDLTSKAEKIPKEAKYYLGREGFGYLAKIKKNIEYRKHS
ncbi:hypothetical protein HYS72_02365 [Candidatus Pacearchaeota archaeon]|nr:hypothetical protein [Candidatus Pacearchaeota archaeon]